MKLTNLEFRACQILLAAARAGADYDEMIWEMRREGIQEPVWLPLYQKIGLMVLVNGEGEDAERYVFAPDNLLPFASPKMIKRAVWPGPIPKTQGGAA
jgi:hypothetical protein